MYFYEWNGNGIHIYNYICVHTHNMSLLMGKIMMNDSMFASQVFRQKNIVSDRKMTIESCYFALLRVAVLFSVQKLQSNEHKL